MLYCAPVCEESLCEWTLCKFTERVPSGQPSFFRVRPEFSLLFSPYFPTLRGMSGSRPRGSSSRRGVSQRGARGRRGRGGGGHSGRGGLRHLETPSFRYCESANRCPVPFLAFPHLSVFPMSLPSSRFATRDGSHSNLRFPVSWEIQIHLLNTSVGFSFPIVLLTTSRNLLAVTSEPR